jgi:hypothetical protein
MTEEETSMVRKHVTDQKMPQLTEKVKNYLKNSNANQLRTYEFGKLAKKSLGADAIFY